MKQKKKPRRSGAPLPLLVPCFFWPAQGPSCVPGGPCGAARASRPRGRRGPGPRPALPLAYTCAAPASGIGHLTRSRPQDSASNRGIAQWEPRKPLGDTRKPRRGQGAPAGLECDGDSRVWPILGPHASFKPSDQSRKPILHKKGPSAKPGPVATHSQGVKPVIE